MKKLWLGKAIAYYPIFCMKSIAIMKYLVPEEQYELHTRWLWRRLWKGIH